MYGAIHCLVVLRFSFKLKNELHIIDVLTCVSSFFRYCKDSLLQAALGSETKTAAKMAMALFAATPIVWTSHDRR